eukprot:752328-Hanusia_phi.AAC.2
MERRDTQLDDEICTRRKRGRRKEMGRGRWDEGDEGGRRKEEGGRSEEARGRREGGGRMEEPGGRREEGGGREMRRGRGCAGDEAAASAIVPLAGQPFPAEGVLWLGHKKTADIGVPVIFPVPSCTGSAYPTPYGETSSKPLIPSLPNLLGSSLPPPGRAAAPEC